MGMAWVPSVTVYSLYVHIVCRFTTCAVSYKSPWWSFLQPISGKALRALRWNDSYSQFRCVALGDFFSKKYSHLIRGANSEERHLSCTSVQGKSRNRRVIAQTYCFLTHARKRGHATPPVHGVITHLQPLPFGQFSLSPYTSQMLTHFLCFSLEKKMK